MRRMQLLMGLLWDLPLWCITDCIDYPLNPAQLSPDALADVPDHLLCEACSRNRASRFQAELQHRGTFTELEWQATKGFKVVWFGRRMLWKDKS